MSESKVKLAIAGGLDAIEYSSGAKMPTTTGQLALRLARIATDNPRFKGKYNIYVCELCRRHILTLDKDAGVTPFTIQCKAEERIDGKSLEEKTCNGHMKSTFYDLGQALFNKVKPKPDMTWRNPTWEEFQAMPIHAQQHVIDFGLVPTTGEV